MDTANNMEEGGLTNNDIGMLHVFKLEGLVFAKRT